TSSQLRPTLYDLLAHRAVNYFQADERDISSSANGFEFRDERVFSSAPVFAGLDLKAADSSSHLFKALKIYQSLLSFHSKDPRPDALIDADIARLQWVYQKAVMENKETLYLQALMQIAGRY